MPPLQDRADFSTPAFSVAPKILQMFPQWGKETDKYTLYGRVVSLTWRNEWGHHWRCLMFILRYDIVSKALDHSEPPDDVDK